MLISECNYSPMVRTSSPTGHCGPGPPHHGLTKPTMQPLAQQPMEDISGSGSEADEAEGQETPVVPTDCLILIFRELDKCSLARCSLACTSWRELCRLQSVWQHRFLVRHAFSHQLARKRVYMHFHLVS